MSTQLSLLPEVMRGIKSYNTRRAYVTQGQERPADLPKLERSAETMESRVLDFFRDGPEGEWLHATPSSCATVLGLEITTVRPRICQLSKPGGPLELCKWLPRVPTKAGGSEGVYRLRRTR